jgi:hypothetical protein
MPSFNDVAKFFNLPDFFATGDSRHSLGITAGQDAPAAWRAHLFTPATYSIV